MDKFPLYLANQDPVQLDRGIERFMIISNTLKINNKRK